MNKFKNKQAQDIFAGNVIKGISPDIIRKAMIKIMMVMAAKELKDLTVPPSNHLEKLKGDRAGQYSVRVNEKYRICFCWNNGEADEIEFVDYH